MGESVQSEETNKLLKSAIKVAWIHLENSLPLLVSLL